MGLFSKKPVRATNQARRQQIQPMQGQQGQAPVQPVPQPMQAQQPNLMFPQFTAPGSPAAALVNYANPATYQQAYQPQVATYQPPSFPISAPAPQASSPLALPAPAGSQTGNGALVNVANSIDTPGWFGADDAYGYGYGYGVGTEPQAMYGATLTASPIVSASSYNPVFSSASVGFTGFDTSSLGLCNPQASFPAAQYAAQPAVFPTATLVAAAQTPAFGTFSNFASYTPTQFGGFSNFGGLNTNYSQGFGNLGGFANTFPSASFSSAFGSPAFGSASPIPASLASFGQGSFYNSPTSGVAGFSGFSGGVGGFGKTGVNNAFSSAPSAMSFDQSAAPKPTSEEFRAPAPSQAAPPQPAQAASEPDVRMITDH